VRRRETEVRAVTAGQGVECEHRRTGTVRPTNAGPREVDGFGVQPSPARDRTNATSSVIAAGRDPECGRGDDRRQREQRGRNVDHERHGRQHDSHGGENE